MAEDNRSSLVQSTAINTIRFLKANQSYSKLSSSSDGQSGSQDNTSVPPETPPDGNQNQQSNGFHAGLDNTPRVLRKTPSLSNKSEVRISTKRIPKVKVDQIKSEVLIEDKINNKNDNFQTQPVNYSDIYSGSENRLNQMDNNRFKMNKQVGLNLENSINKTNQNSNNNKQSNSATSSRESTVLLKTSMSNSSLLLDINLQNMKEYKVIDIDYAIQYVLKRSKAIEQLIEQEGLYPSFIETMTSKSKFFRISYDCYLQTEIIKKNINEQFKNVSKRMFEKLEQFFVKRIQKTIETTKTQSTYVKSSKGIYQKLEQRIKELKKELAEPGQIQ